MDNTEKLDANSIGTRSNLDASSIRVDRDLREEVALIADCFGKDVAEQFLKLRVGEGRGYEHSLRVALYRCKKQKRDKLSRGWFFRLSRWGKEKYREVVVAGTLCEKHEQYLSDCLHFREWLIEADNENRG